MDLWSRLRATVHRSRAGTAGSEEARSYADRFRTDGGERSDRDESADEENETVEADEDADTSGDASNVDVVESGEAEPAEPRWERIDPDDIPKFEIRADEPAGFGGSTGNASTDDPAAEDRDLDPTEGRPNAARSPGRSRIKREGAEGYIVALELCSRLPDDVRLPDEAADLVPAAVEAELEEDIRAFAAAEFETTSPTVETLSFVEVDDEVWLRIRLGISPQAFADLDPEEIRAHALQRLEGLF